MTVIEVFLKSQIKDGEGQTVCDLLNDANLPATAVRIAKLYRVEGTYNDQQLQRLTEELLCDPITELAHRVEATNAQQDLHRIEVWLKPGVSDPEAESTKRAIRFMHLPKPLSLHCGRAYFVSGIFTQENLKNAIVKTLVNPVIHTWQI